MAAKLVDENGRTVLQIDVYEILHDILKASDRQDLIQSLACTDDIIQHVMDQVLEGFTYDGYRGSECQSMNTPLQQARLRIVKECEYVARHTIADFERRVKSLEDQVEHYRTHYEPIRRNNW